MLTVKGDKHIDLKEFRIKHHLRALSFASADDLLKILGLTPGSVTPFGLFNDQQHIVTFYLDNAFLGNKIGVHPNDNRATVWLQAKDLLWLIQENGNQTEVIKM